jgi:sorbitol-specific phosphotransferase system component IIBC
MIHKAKQSKAKQSKAKQSKAKQKKTQKTKNDRNGKGLVEKRGRGMGWVCGAG